MRSSSKLLAYGLLGLWSLVCLLPLYWVAITSLKGTADIDQPPGYVPFLDFAPTLDAWRFILFAPNENLVARFANSLFIGCFATLLSVGSACLALYALTRFAPAYRWFGLDRMTALVLATRVLPPALIVIPLHLLALRTGLQDTRTAMVLIYAAINLPVAFWLLLPVFGLRASTEEEAAQLDGASHLRILMEIWVPMQKAAIAASALLIFLLCWNEYLFAAYIAVDHAMTLPPWAVGQLSMKEAQVGGQAEEWAHLSAATIFMVVPALLLSAFMHHQIGRSALPK